MNAKKFKTVEQCETRLALLEKEIAAAECLPPATSFQREDYKNLLLANLKSQQATIFRRREHLKTNELPFGCLTPGAAVRSAAPSGLTRELLQPRRKE